MLSKFNKHKSKLPAEQKDINRYTSVRELYNVLQPYLNIQTRSEIKQDAEKVYEDEQWLIIIPHTEEAACSYGANTKWCTTAKENNMFDYYNGMGPLYINIHKPTNRKYQFHFESGQFMDEEDDEIQPNKLPWTEGAKNYYKSINKYVYLIFDEVDHFDSNGIAMVKLNGKYNWFSTEKQDYLFPNQWFDDVSYFRKNGIARVKLNDKFNFFSSKKQELLFPNQWFDEVGGFNYNGIVIVELNGKYNWLNINKDRLVWDKPIEQWFDWVSEFDNNDIARVELNDKRYYFTLDGKFLDYDTQQLLSDKELQSLQKQQQIEEMVNRLVKNYLR